MLVTHFKILLIAWYDKAIGLREMPMQLKFSHSVGYATFSLRQVVLRTTGAAFGVIIFAGRALIAFRQQRADGRMGAEYTDAFRIACWRIASFAGATFSRRCCCRRYAGSAIFAPPRARAWQLFYASRHGGGVLICAMLERAAYEAGRRWGRRVARRQLH